MKSKNVILVVLLVAIVGFGSYVAVFGFPQTAIAYKPTVNECQDQLKNWCAKSYSCTPCEKKVLPYNLIFSSVTTNTVYGADCVYGSNPKDAQHIACQESENVASHTGWWCYDNDVYYYNSIGSREEKKSECPYGCSSGVSGGFAKISCDAKPTTPITPAPSPIVTPTCQVVAGCDENGKRQCDSGSSFQICHPEAGLSGCLKWGESLYCKVDEVCDQGSCAKVVPPPVVTVCEVPSPSSSCDSATVIKTFSCNADDLLVKDYTKCASGQKCENAVCVPVSTPPSPPNISCVGVTCPDFCDANYALNSQGVCDASTKICTYGKVETSSTQCLPKENCTGVLGAELTGCVVNGVDTQCCIVPPRPDQNKSWFEKFGLYGGIAVVLFLIAVYINLDAKGKKRGGRK